MTLHSNGLYAGLARIPNSDAEWFEREKRLAQALIGARVETCEIIVRKLAKDTPYPFRFWWPRILARMAKGERGVPAYDAEIAHMRAVHKNGKRLTLARVLAEAAGVRS